MLNLKYFLSFLPRMKVSRDRDFAIPSLTGSHLSAQELRAIEKILNYRFKKPDVLLQALTHSSLGHENSLEDNERLEFLGDSVLGAVVSHRLFNMYPDYDEGPLTKIKSRLVSRTTLLRLAQKLGLGRYLLLGKGEEKSLGREKPSNLTNMMESLIAAVYLDGGFEAARKVILEIWKDEIENDSQIENYKGLLQEYSQKMFQCNPSYKVIRVEGPEHRKIFTVQASVKDLFSEGLNSSKSLAEQMAAHNLLKKIGVLETPAVVKE